MRRAPRRSAFSGVPFFVIDGRYGVSGAQPPEVILNALQTAWAASQPLTIVSGDAESDDGDTGALRG